MYAHGFRVYFTPLPGFFSPFPHGTSSLSVDHEYLALEDGPPIFRQDYTCPALLIVRLVPPKDFRVRGYHPLRLTFPGHSTNRSTITYRLFRFRSPLLSESRLISFLELLRCFSSPGSPPQTYVFSMRYPCGWVSPFGNLRIKANLPAPRSLSQAITSFVAYHCQGIHHVLLFT